MKVTFSFLDKSNERSSSLVYLPEVTAGGLNWDTVKAAAQSIESAIKAVSLAGHQATLMGIDVSAGSPVEPTDPYAQREIGLKIFYSDDVTGRKYSMTVPAPDLANVAVTAGSDNAVLTDEPLATLVSALETNAKSQDGNAITVTSARVVGRRN